MITTRTSLAPPEEKTDANTSINLSELPDFDEVLPCICRRGSRCSIGHGEECSAEATVIAAASPCGCQLTMCLPCAETTRKQVQLFARISKIPMIDAVALCAKDLQRIEDIAITPI